MTEVAIIGRCFKKPKNESMCMQQYAIASVSKNGLRWPQNDLGGCRDQAIIFSIKSYPCMPQAGSHSMQGMAGHSGQTVSVSENGLGGLKMTSEAAGTRPIIFSIKSYPCMAKAGSHSIQGMAGHAGQPCKQTNKQIPLCFIYIGDYYSA